MVLEAREHLANGDADGAIALLNEARETDPDNPRVTLVLAEAQFANGDVAAAESLLDSLPADEQLNSEVDMLRSRLFFEGQVAKAPGMSELEARVSADPADHEALFQLALRKAVDQDYETAIELLLHLMQQDCSFGDDAARRGLLKVFDLLGDDPRVNQYRRRMASLLH
jgi:putative thioredoxin